MTRLAIIGAAGRMGKRLIALGLADDAIELVGAVDMAGSPAIGQDAGILAGVSECGVRISTDVAAVAGSQTQSSIFQLQRPHLPTPKPR